MVFYEYLCHTHGAFNIMRRLGKAPSQAPCPSCGSLLAPDKDPNTATCAKCGTQVRVSELVTV